MQVSLFWAAVLAVIAVSAHAVSSDVAMTDGGLGTKRTAADARYIASPTDIATHR
ncbi:hypothetical protein [Methylobacillus sp. MM3]|jgi:hypothetical protein|uniref:hypothetical protein n=1 Tax=Methylobacillus sp. MM3 TaxID=1848039 RepID=UPI0013F4DE6C|nr:hypothetical protein [Methylobacillus sp. MM3]